MALYAKESVTWASETVSSISKTKFIAGEHQLALAKSVSQNANTMVSSSVDTLCDTKPTPTSTYSLPSLAPLAGQDMEVRVLAVGGMAQQPLHMNALCGRQRDQDRRVRREIANSNERRRMQSINAGFKSLKAILPVTAGEKLSKAAILQHTAEFIIQLEDDKRKLRYALSECRCTTKHKGSLLCDGHEKDEGIGSPREEDMEELRRDTMEIHRQLDKERSLRLLLEEKVRELESQNKVKEIAQTVMDQQRQIYMSASIVDDNSHVVTIKKEGDPARNSFETSPHNLPTVQSFDSTKPEYLPTNIQPVMNSLPAEDIYPVPETTEVVPPAALCVTVPQHSDSKSSESTRDPTKVSGGLPRSSQPLKKRAFPDTDRSSPACKLPRLQTSSVFDTISNASSVVTSPVLLSPSLQSKTVYAPNNPTVPIQGGQLLQTTPAGRMPEKLSYSTGFFPIAQPVAVQEHPVLLSAPNSVAPTFISLQPPVLTASSSPWHETQATLAPPNLPVVTTHPSSSHYVLQPALPRIASNSEELTLNQLNSLPSLSMTLTQLNALPNMTRINAVSGSTVLPGHRPQQPQFLPIVAMDTVLSRHGERRNSSATTDSAVSDEDGKIDVAEYPSHNEYPHKTPAFKNSRTRSDPLPCKEAIERKNSSPNVKCTTTLSVLSDGPGSPTVIRRIDPVATRRNLETIVQAIDHLEQQERRNSQDQQMNSDSPVC